MADKQVRYEIRADVKGRESITGLADDLDDVAKVLSGELSQQAQAAATRLRELAEQDAAITAFNRLQAEARDAGRALKAAETEAANYGKQITALGPPTAQEAAALQRLQATAESARATFGQQQQALAGAQGELQRYGIAGQNAQAAQQRLRQEVALVRDSVQGLAPAYQGAAAGAQNAGSSMNRTHRAIGDGVESISQQLARLQSFYAGFAGLQGFKAIATDLAKTADEVNNLQARLKLVTGEGDNFTRSWQGVTEVALRTHSALEETGVLFTRLAQAGKDAGLTTAQASAQSLALTETINQAIQLSGASAQASSAAITQLVQGLQGGALRGDEFNSVMEQSPRLARALADGLGVTTGELRKMAEAGLLTSDTVIKALQGQSQTVATEFSKLPPTVGRALQDLSTQWTLYIGETDKATGASSAAATAISALASNLRTIAGLLIDVGQAAAAFAALRLAQQFLGLSAAAQASAAAVAANNAQMVAAGPAAATAAASAGRFATILASLRTFTLVGIVANFKDIGTWIGQSAAKLAGYKDRTEELARAEKVQAETAKQAAADRARLAASIQAAIDRTFDLSKAARSSVAEFEQLTKEGNSTAEALKKATDSFDLNKVQGIRDFSSVLEKLSAEGKISIGELQAAWSQALNGKDLADFEIKARMAFGAARAEAEKAAAAVQAAIARGVNGDELTALKAKAEAAFAVLTRESSRAAQLTDSLLREAVRRTGLEYEQLQGKIGSVSRSAINDVEAIVAGMDRLKAQGVDTGRVLVASLSKAISTADGQAAIDNLRGRIEQMRKVLGDKITDGLLDQAREKANALKDALDQATPGINSVREAMKQLGITSDESLKKTAADAKDAYDTLTASGTASARELGEGFKRAAEAAIAANKGIAPAWVEGQAAMRGFKVVTDEAGRSTLELSSAVDKSTASMRAGSGSASAHAAAVRDVGSAYSDAAAKALAAQGQFLAAAAAQKSADTSASSITNRPQSENQFAWTRLAIIDWLKQAGLDDETAKRVSGDFVDASGNVPYSNNAGQIKYGGRNSTMTQALYKAAEQHLFKGNSGAGAPAPSPSPSPSPAPSPGTGSGAGNTYVNNITINGVGDWGVVRGTTRHADAQSAETEIDLLRKLAQAQGASI
ncbi:tape measure protein [Acidovorax sp. BLS4]|uniref:tape measure protein n=1 Tax=Acidovorax sp. BLS4 TaxID=3273430 RepID=UPI002943D572|nr:tape measure protein [Paracidovorax avenae]WOI47693.1 tape measure protein [Paracidovorax avenae]